jgi:predicted nucleic acid-binding Zn ribbon protein
VHFKGSGFYSTDYGRGSRKKEPSTDGAGGDSGSGSKKDSDKKPETKAAESS